MVDCVSVHNYIMDNMSISFAKSYLKGNERTLVVLGNLPIEQAKDAVCFLQQCGVSLVSSYAVCFLQRGGVICNHT